MTRVFLWPQYGHFIMYSLVLRNPQVLVSLGLRGDHHHIRGITNNNPPHVAQRGLDYNITDQDSQGGFCTINLKIFTSFYTLNNKLLRYTLEVGL